MKRYIIATLAALLSFAAATAQTATEATEPQLQADGDGQSLFKVKVGLETRVDFEYDDVQNADNNASFEGRYLNFMVDGEINSKLNFHFRQRLNKFGDMRSDVFGATDWVYINYCPDEHWTLSGGKQVVAIGGYEYDRAPIDIYFASRFWNNIACYQFGVSGAYTTTDGHHTVLAQMCNSPYQTIGNSCFAYNLMWMGSMGSFSTIWSLNAMQYERSRWGNFISLGNRFNLPSAYIELDLMNRYWGHGHYLLDDYSVIAKACYSAGRFDIFAKGGYERYAPTPGVDSYVEKPFYGAGVEYFPLRNSRNLRISVVGDVTHDNAGVRTTQLLASLKWHVDIFKRNY